MTFVVALLLLLITASFTLAQQQEQSSYLRGDSSHSHHWLQEYIQFHRQQRRRQNNKSNVVKYLVLDYNTSHGASLESNLLHIPYHLWLAYKTKRVFVLGETWRFGGDNSSCGIEHVWKPNQLDWTMPNITTTLYPNDDDDDVIHLYPTDDDEFIQTKKLEEQYSGTRVIRILGNPTSFVLGLGNVFQEELKGRQVFKRIYQALFSLQEPMQQLLNNIQEDLFGEKRNQEYIAVYLNAPVNLIQQQQQQLLDRSKPAAADLNYERQAKMEQHLNFEKVVQRTKLLNGNHHQDSTVLLYCAGTDDDSINNRLPDCINQKDSLQETVLRMTDSNDISDDNSACTAQQYAPRIIDLYLAAQASCIGFGSEDAGLAATLFGNLECYSVHDLNPTVLAAAQRWDSPFYPNPSGRQRQQQSEQITRTTTTLATV